jgi:hypothetical protein
MNGFIWLSADPLGILSTKPEPTTNFYAGSTVAPISSSSIRPFASRLQSTYPSPTHEIRLNIARLRNIIMAMNANYEPIVPQALEVWRINNI